MLERGEPLDGLLQEMSGRPEASGIRAKGAGPGFRVYERVPFLPRARLVAHAHRVEGPQAALDRLFGPDFDPAGELVLESPGAGAGAHPAAGDVMVAEAGPGSELASARIVVDEPERVEVEVETPRAAYLLLSDAWAPGWSARVDGAPAAILRAEPSLSRRGRRCGTEPGGLRLRAHELSPGGWHQRRLPSLARLLRPHDDAPLGGPPIRIRMNRPARIGCLFSDQNPPADGTVGRASLGSSRDDTTHGIDLTRSELYRNGFPH